MAMSLVKSSADRLVNFKLMLRNSTARFQRWQSKRSTIWIEGNCARCGGPVRAQVIEKDSLRLVATELKRQSHSLAERAWRAAGKQITVDGVTVKVKAFTR